MNNNDKTSHLPLPAVKNTGKQALPSQAPVQPVPQGKQTVDPTKGSVVLETKDSFGSTQTDSSKRPRTWADMSETPVVPKFDVTNLAKSLQRFQYGSALKHRSDVRSEHHLTKGTLAALGHLGLQVSIISQAVGLPLHEDEGETLTKNDNLVKLFTSEGINPNWVSANASERRAAEMLTTLVTTFPKYDPLGVFIDGDNLAFIYVRFHQIKYIQKLWFQSDIGDYVKQSRIGSDRRNDLIQAILPWFGNANAADQFVGLIEKFIERSFIEIKRGPESAQNELLLSHKTSFLSISKAYEKSLPVVEKKSVSDAAQKKLARGKYQLKPQDYTVRKVVQRPVLETSGFLTPEEKLNLAGFNRKLNEFGNHLPDIQTADGSARRQFVLKLSATHSARIALVNRVIKARKGTIHRQMVVSRNQALSEQKSDKAEKKPFSAEDWRQAFASYNKSDLSSALLQSFGADLESQFNISKYTVEVSNSPTSIDISAALSSESDREAPKESSTIVMDS